MTVLSKLFPMSGVSATFADETEWKQAAARAGVTEITPFDCKAVFAVAIVRTRLESTGYLLRGDTGHSPFLLAATAVEAIGHMATGAVGGPGQIFAAGFDFVFPDGFVATDQGSLSHNDVWSLRNYIAHGAVKPGEAGTLPGDLTVALMRGMADALDRFWENLRSGDVEQLDRFLTAQISPIFTNSCLVFVSALYRPLANGGKPGGSMHNDKTWRAKPLV